MVYVCVPAQLLARLLLAGRVLLQVRRCCLYVCKADDHGGALRVQPATVFYFYAAAGAAGERAHEDVRAMLPFPVRAVDETVLGRAGGADSGGELDELPAVCGELPSRLHAVEVQLLHHIHQRLHQNGPHAAIIRNAEAQPPPAQRKLHV